MASSDKAALDCDNAPALGAIMSSAVSKVAALLRARI
jgi:hypothetical protein